MLFRSVSQSRYRLGQIVVKVSWDQPVNKKESERVINSLSFSYRRERSDNMKCFCNDFDTTLSLLLNTSGCKVNVVSLCGRTYIYTKGRSSYRSVLNYVSTLHGVDISKVRIVMLNKWLFLVAGLILTQRPLYKEKKKEYVARMIGNLLATLLVIVLAMSAYAWLDIVNHNTSSETSGGVTEFTRWFIDFLKAIR